VDCFAFAKVVLDMLQVNVQDGKTYFLYHASQGNSVELYEHTGKFESFLPAWWVQNNEDF
jgi:hypothetical protein